jgi:peroxiredoxin
VIKIILSFVLLMNMAQAKTLNEALTKEYETFTEKMPKDVVKLYQQNIKDLKAAGIEKQTLNVGDKAPDIQLNLGGELWPLSSVYAAGPVVLKFYRGGWCPYCMAELKHYKEMYDEVKKAGGQLIAITPDTSDMIQQNDITSNLPFDVISDEGHALAEQFGLVYDLDEKVIEQLKKDGIDLSVYQGNDDGKLAIPATYVIDQNGKIAFAYVDADYTKRASPEKVVKVIKELSDEN